MLTDVVKRTPPGRGRGAHPDPAQPRRGPARAPGRCSTRASRSATWSGSSRRSRCGPAAPRTSTRSSRPPGSALGPAIVAPYLVDGRVHVITLEPAARAADARVAAARRAGRSASRSTPTPARPLLHDARAAHRRTREPQHPTGAGVRAPAAGRAAPAGAPDRPAARRAVLPASSPGPSQIRSEGVVSAERLAVNA